MAQALYDIISNINKQIKAICCKIDTLGGGGSSQPAYKVYTALLNLSGTDDPVATVLENTLGSDIIWKYTQPGIYSGENINFTNPNKVFIICTGSRSGEGNGNINSVGAELWDSGSGIKLWFATFNDVAYSDNWGAPIFIEIRVYN